MELKKLQKKQLAYLKKKGKLPKRKLTVVLRLVEDVGEICEAIREHEPREEFEEELANVFWQLNRLCYLYDVDLEKAFMKKLKKK